MKCGSLVAPSLQEQLTHEIAHIPFAPWCECCVATRSREDPGSTRTMTRTNVAPTFALDYMFTNTPGDDGEGPDSKMNVHLVGYDSWSKQVMCLPVAKKGGNSLKAAVKEVLRHTSSYAEVIFKADTGPALKQLVKTLMEVRGKLGYKSSIEWVPPDRHNANPAERAAAFGQHVVGDSACKNSFGAPFVSSHILLGI